MSIFLAETCLNEQTILGIQVKITTHIKINSPHMKLKVAHMKLKVAHEVESSTYTAKSTHTKVKMPCIKAKQHI